MIRCTDICLSFSEKTVFNNFSFNVNEGEHVCFAGQSGRGKTTLIKLLQGYVIPEKGQIQINNQALTSSSVKVIRESITWIPQNINLPVNNGWELIKLMKLHSQKEQVRHTIQELDLEKDILYEDFNQISGGEKQRVIISICLSLNKRIVLMDEPTASLDDVSIKTLINFLGSLNKKTIVSATHNKLLMNSANRIINL